MDFGSLFHIVKVALVMIVMISVLVAAHEYGHYLFARMFKMGVEEFAIGFGRKPIWTWMRKTYEVEGVPGGGSQTPLEDYVYATDGSSALAPEPAPNPSQTKLTVTETTDFTVRPWPLGGFVRIKGMLPEDDGSETQVPGGFYSKAPWKRFLVLLAGPLFSVGAGVAILTVLYATNGTFKPVNEPLIAQVEPNSPAYEAGIRDNDRIVSLDGNKVSTFYEITAYVRPRANKPIKVEFLSGKEKTLKTGTMTPTLDPVTVFTPDLSDITGHEVAGRVGIGYDKRHVDLTLGQAFADAVNNPVRVVSGLLNLFKKPSEFKESVGGPGTIAKVTSDATKEGILPIIELAAMLSISVGIFNLLPVPPLDGGQMLVAVAEMLRGGRRLSMKVQGAVAAIGLTLVAMLVVSVLFIDFGRLSTANKKSKETITKQTK